MKEVVLLPDLVCLENSCVTAIRTILHHQYLHNRNSLFCKKTAKKLAQYYQKNKKITKGDIRLCFLDPRSLCFVVHKDHL